MRYSKLLGKTLKDSPKDEVSINAKLLLRGGFIDKLMAGSYTLLHLGRKVEQKIEQIVREEMNDTGAEEILMPLLHPKEIWNETGRWDKAKEVMYQFEKNEKEYALSFTHEEIVMNLLRKHVSSYKDLPVKVYHFSTKFRSEARAKSGILRGREFLMKDLYSAHESEEDFMRYLDTHEIPDPDMIIRTAGEYRLSGFMPVQGAYAEFYFTDRRFPDFGPEDLRAAVSEFVQRKRNYGK